MSIRYYANLPGCLGERICSLERISLGHKYDPSAEQCSVNVDRTYLYPAILIRFALEIPAQGDSAHSLVVAAHVVKHTCHRFESRHTRLLKYIFVIELRVMCCLKY